MTDRKQEENPSSMLEGDNEEVRAGLYAALMEAVARFVLSLGWAVDAKKTRSLNNYAFKDAFKATALKSMARYVGVKKASVTAFDVAKAGVHRLRFSLGHAGQQVVNTSDALFIEALRVNEGVKRAAAAIVAFHQWEASDILQREAMRRAMEKATGGRVTEVPEGMTVATGATAHDLGLEEGDFVRHVEVEQASLLRQSFAHLRDKLNGVSFVDESNFTTTMGSGRPSQVVLDAEQETMLTVNRLNLLDWAASFVKATAWYCAPCKSAGNSHQFGNGQVSKAGNACPNCGEPRRNLGRNSNTAHLPLLTTAWDGVRFMSTTVKSEDGKVSVIGGHRLELRAFRFTKPAYVALEEAVHGYRTVESALKAITAERAVSIRQHPTKGKGWERATLVPCMFEVQVNGSFEQLLGLAVERIPTAEDITAADL